MKGAQHQPDQNMFSIIVYWHERTGSECATGCIGKYFIINLSAESVPSCGDDDYSLPLQFNF